MFIASVYIVINSFSFISLIIGAFLLEDGICMILWIGREIASSFLVSLFGVTSLDGIDLNLLSLGIIECSE